MTFEAIKHSVAASLAAIVLTSTAVGAAVGPARAIETSPVVYAQAAAPASHV